MLDCSLNLLLQLIFMQWVYQSYCTPGNYMSCSFLLYLPACLEMGPALWRTMHRVQEKDLRENKALSPVLRPFTCIILAHVQVSSTQWTSSFVYKQSEKWNFDASNIMFKKTSWHRQGRNQTWNLQSPSQPGVTCLPAHCFIPGPLHLLLAFGHSFEC